MDLGEYLAVGEAFEEHDDLAAATVWFTGGLQPTESEYGYERLAVRRLGVRRAQGFPADEDDELAMNLIAERQADR